MWESGVGRAVTAVGNDGNVFLDVRCCSRGIRLRRLKKNKIAGSWCFSRICKSVFRGLGLVFFFYSGLNLGRLVVEFGFGYSRRCDFILCVTF